MSPGPQLRRASTVSGLATSSATACRTASSELSSLHSTARYAAPCRVAVSP